MSQITVFSNAGYFQYYWLLQNRIQDYLFHLRIAETGLGTFFRLISLNFNEMEINESSGFEVSNDFDFLAQ